MYRRAEKYIDKNGFVKTFEELINQIEEKAGICQCPEKWIDNDNTLNRLENELINLKNNSSSGSTSGDISNSNITYTKTYYSGAEPTKYTDASQTGKLSDVLSTIYELAAEGAEDNIQNRICHYTLSDGRQFDGPLSDHLIRFQEMNDQFTQGFMTEIAPVIQSNMNAITELRNDVDRIQIQADAVTDISAKKVTYTKSNFDEASGTTQTYTENDEITDVLTDMSSEIASAKNISNRNVNYYTSGGSRQSDTLANHIKNLNTKTTNNSNSITSLETRTTDVETRLNGLTVTCSCDHTATMNKLNNLVTKIKADLNYIWKELSKIHTELPKIGATATDGITDWNVTDISF